MPDQEINRGIFAGLVKAIDWYDNSLQNLLASRGLKVVNRTQAMMLVHIASGNTRPSAIARKMRLSRQNIHAMAKVLIGAQLIVLNPDPMDGRAGCYALSEDASGQRDAALEILGFLEGRLADRIGKDTVRELNRALAADWGEPITKMFVD